MATLGARLVQLEQQRVAPDLRAEWEAERARWVERFWAAVAAILTDGMPREFAAQVVAELQADGPRAEPSALASRVLQLGQHAGWAPQARFPYQGPYVVPRAHCALLVAEPAGAVRFAALACTRCHLAAPYGSRGGQAPWALYLDATCAYCGGTEIAWPPHLQS